MVAAGGRAVLGYLSIALIAAAALAYQLLLLRFMAIVHWPLFAAMIISLALLGHGASGTVLTLARGFATERFEPLFVGNAVALAAGVIVCPLLGQQLPFNGLELVWYFRQWFWLTALYLLLALPFFFAANCFGLAFLRFREHIPAVYAADLMGAGAGALAIVGALWLWSPGGSLRAVALLALAAALLACFALDRRRLGWPILAAALMVLALPAAWLTPQVNEFKGLPRLLAVSGAGQVAERSSPLAWLAVVESPRIPLRHAPGMSLMATQEPPPQLAVFGDGDAMNVITRHTGDPSKLAYLQQTSSALPYALVSAPEVLVLNAGTGTSVLQALVAGARSVTAVEQNRQLVELLRGEFAEFAGGLYDDPRVTVRIAEARAFARDTRASFDVIVLDSADSLAGAVAGAQASADAYAYTVEAFRDYFDLLNDGGLLAVTRWDKRPPRDGLKLFATAIDALPAEGISEPGRHLVLIRSWQTLTLLVQRTPLTPEAVKAVRAFCRERLFDVVYDPGIALGAPAQQADAERDELWRGAQALLAETREDYVERYKFNIVPATDDRPYFFHFFRWQALPELLRLREQGAVVLLDSGYLLLIASLAQALPLALLLILLPLHSLSSGNGNGHHRRLPPALYFLCLGLGFLFIEIACLQRLTLHIGHPLLAATVTIGSFLLFAGAGSAWVQRRIARHRFLSVQGTALGVAMLALSFVALDDAVFAALALDSEGLRALAGAALIAPLAVLMGMLFPAGLERLSRRAPAFVPWAWGINGCASVLSPLLATLLSIHFGVYVVMAAAALLYIGAGFVWAWLR